MKTVNYFGKDYEVGDNINFLATDKNGMIFGYESEPTRDSTGYWYSNGSSFYIDIVPIEEYFKV